MYLYKGKSQLEECFFLTKCIGICNVKSQRLCNVFLTKLCIGICNVKSQRLCNVFLTKLCIGKNPGICNVIKESRKEECLFLTKCMLGTSPLSGNC